ncbi:MAG: alpha/beta hydrolase [Ilumatobacteraceae bacterium]|jgi:phospholipase/carboxylesterase
MVELAFRLDGRVDAGRLLVMLHGYGATQHDLATIAPTIDPDHRFLVLSPRGPIPVAGGGASWYDFDASWRPDPASFAGTLSALDALVDDICGRFGIDRHRSVVGGFSQGAGMAAWLAYATPEHSRPAGLWCCGTVVEVDDRPLDLATADGTDVLVLAGRHDPNVPLPRNLDQAARLRAAGADVTLSEHDGGHGLSTPMLADMRSWLRRLP